MKYSAAAALGLCTLAGLGSLDKGGADPTGPGASVERYATVDWPAWLSFDRGAGVLFAGVETGPAARVWRIAAGGSPVNEYGAVPIQDPDAVLHDAAGLLTGVPGSVLVGGRGGGTPQI